MKKVYFLRIAPSFFHSQTSFSHSKLRSPLIGQFHSGHLYKTMGWPPGGVLSLQQQQEPSSDWLSAVPIMHDSFFLKCFVYFCYYCSLLYIKLPFFRKQCGVVLLSGPGIQGVQFLRPRSPFKDTCVYFQHLDCWTVIGAEKHPHHCGFISFFSTSSSLFPYFSPSSSSFFHFFFCSLFSVLSSSFFSSSSLKSFQPVEATIFRIQK